MNTLVAVLPYIAMLAIFYLIIFIPENKRKKKFNTMLSNLKLNDEILTRGGVIGKIVNIKDDFIILETGPDRARLKLTKNAVANVLNNNTEESK